MAKYQITGPDGGSYEINAPDDATPEQVRSFVISNFSGQQKPAGPKGNASDGGVLGGIVRGLRDPIDGGAQILRRLVPDSVGQAVDRFGNALADMGLPVARSEGVGGVDKIVKDTNAQYEADRAAAGRAGFDVARLTGNVINPVNRVLPGVGNANGLRALAVGGMKAGAANGLLQPVTEDTDNFWESKAKQVAAGALAGGLVTPVLAKGIQVATNVGGKAINAVMPSAPMALTPAQMEISINRVLESQGMNAREVPQQIQDSVRRQLAEAVSTGRRVDPAAAIRIAEAEAVGLTGDAALTAGQAARSPMQYARERNLSGIEIQTPTGPSNMLADRFQAQANALQGVFDQAGATRAVNPNSAGIPIMDALRAADAPVRAGVDDLYNTARAMTGGRAAELDSAAFSQTANRALDEGMWGHSLPADVRNVLNDITSGKTPLNVGNSVQIDSFLSAAQRRAARAGDDAAAAAIGIVRTSLNNAPLAAEQAATRAPGVAEAARAAGVVDNGITDVPFRDVMPTGLPGQRALPAAPGRQLATEADFQMPQPAQPGTAVGPVAQQAAPRMSEGEAARAAFEQARRAARDRFATIESTPALRAALEGEAPDRFVQRYIIGADARDLAAMRRVLENSPEALDQARAQIANHLKRAAFGDNLSGDGNFAAARFAATLRSIGPERLRVFFSPEEIMRFNLAGKVASDINSIPAGAKNAVNTSGTAAGVFNLLQKIGDAPLLRNIPGVRGLANQAGEIANERAIQQAARAQPSAAVQTPTELTPEQVRAIQMFLTPAAQGAGATAGNGF
ncbi:hypothetical protein [Roseateles depolymerans]|uniref:Uncharacterized protein n=1 Tax=Roseateles depolymerans TaxID=76731 RepID=A0A0U3LJY6_9BURK|nr:hypothetical protein [Roseateles depolymerans]ALV06706.1 hypothetical protein RD2015_2234 [Roseateles depolymerans]REG19683.1 hypothetical protein DES44_2183 [Roseateles depolymerans]